MSEEDASGPVPETSDEQFQDGEFSPFSEEEVECNVCGMNIVRSGEDLARHRDFHAAAPQQEPDRSQGPPIP